MRTVAQTPYCTHGVEHLTVNIRSTHEEPPPTRLRTVVSGCRREVDTTSDNLPKLKLVANGAKLP